MQDPTSDEAIDGARAAGDASEGFRRLKAAFVFGGQALARDAARFAKGMRALADIGGRLAGADFAALAQAAADRPDDVAALQALASWCLEEGIPDIALVPLERAHAAAPEDGDVLADLITAFEDTARYDRARETLERVPGLEDADLFWRYRLGFVCAMCGDVEATAAILRRLEPETDDERFMTGRLAAIVERHARVAGALDLRGWHYVLSGGLLQHLSAFGFAEGMNGRYAFTSDSEARCRYGLERLRVLIAALGPAAPRRILQLPGRGAQVLGLAAERVLGLPLAPLDDGPGLVVAYDLAELQPDVVSALWKPVPGQIVYAHATCWTSPPAFAPDVTTVLYQTQHTPWGQRLRIDPETQKMERVPPSTASDEALARAVVESGGFEDVGAPGDDDATYERFVRAVAPSIGPWSSARRETLWIEGPVRSSRFL